jgi:IclR-like helix-turn-helix domain-containing protein
MVWRQLLVAALDQGSRRTSLSELSHQLGLPASTVHQALERPRSIGAMRGGYGGLRLLDPRRLQLLWAARRDLEADIVYATRVVLPIREIEARLPASAIPTAYTAFVRHQGGNLVADYDQVVVYGSADELRRRFAPRKGQPNLVVLEPDPLLARYGPVARRCQVYADLFNLPTWQAQRFLGALDQEMLRDVA